MNKQIKWSFDKITLQKIAKGALYSISPAVAVALGSFFMNIDFGNAVINSFVAWFTPFAVNAVKEWSNGE